MAGMAGDMLYKKYNIHEGVKCLDQENLPEMYLNNTWRPNVSITGIDGVPTVAKGGNVLRESTSVRISMRLAPNANATEIRKVIEKKLTENVPYNAKVTITGDHSGQGWCMKEMAPWFKDAVYQAGRDFFDGNEGKSYGMGGSIPLMSQLEKMYPKSTMIALGLIGPKANAHGPNECINLTYAKKLTCALSHMLAAVGTQK
jgi:acetylornithine deacetylase/succinyl-diaminopimelate desuccinylase-like protein